MDNAVMRGRWTYEVAFGGVLEECVEFLNQIPGTVSEECMSNLIAVYKS